MSDAPNFDTVRRGYDPDQVDRAVADLQHAASQATLAAEEARNEAAQLRQEGAAYRTRVSALEDERNSASAYSALPDLAERINRMLTSVDNETKQILAQAKAEARRITEESATAAEQLRKQADDYAKETKNRVDTESVRIIAEAQQEANDVLDHADRESTARRDEAEAIFEQQRARAAAMAAEFEQTLAERRDKAASEFQAQMQAQQDAIAAAEDRRATIESEAERYKAETQVQADAALTAANNQAYEIVEQARLSAERVRRESERELAAAASRRDAITAQLTNIRQMLGTVGGAQALESFPMQDASSYIQPAPEAVETSEAVAYEADGDDESRLQLLIDEARQMIDEDSTES